MSVTADEKYQSRRGGTGDFAYEERDFIVRGSDDPLEINAAALAHDDCTETITTTDGTLYRVGIRNRQQDGNGIWTVTVAYESNEVELAVGQKRHRWSTVGGTQRFLVARNHIATYDSGGSTTTTDADWLLGWDGSTVNGADVVVPVFSFEVDIALADISGLAATVLSLTGKVNNGSFYGFAAGEVLYLGATRNDRGNGIKDVTHYFAAQPNRTSVSVGSVTVPAVKGWEVLSVASTDASPPAVEYVYLDQVYESGDFSSLGVGTSES